MENATDALKMAGFVLIFVLALSISINAFGQARQTATTILEYQDREYDYTYVEDNGTTQRIVSAETIVPSIYKAYKENYKIVFKDRNKQPMELYTKSNGEVVSSIDLETSAIGSDEQKEQFIRLFLYGEKYQSEIDDFNRNSGINLPGTNFYDTIKEEVFIEYLGIYYQEEIQGSSASTANKNKKRVITYVQQ